MKRTIKYLLIILINLIVLTILLAIWTDKFEMTFNSRVRPIEFLKVLGFSLLSLIGIRVLIWYFRKKGIHSIKQKIKIASLLTLILCSYLYVDYFIKIFRNQIINREIRISIIDKVKPANILANGTKADNLTFNEYRLISKTNQFPDLSEKANNISYIYTYDSFLPDYSFTLIYDLPLDTDIKEINFTNGHFSKSQTIDKLFDKLRVTYDEFEHQ